MTITAYGSIKEGKLTLANRKRFDADIKEFKDCVVELSIRKKNQRSTQQNNFLWGVVYPEIVARLRDLGNDGVDSEWVHEWCKSEFNPIEIIGEGGEVIGKRGGSTVKMNKEEMSLYWDKIIRWAGEFLQIHIPMPNDNLTLNF